jgi:hypothetical protein
MIAFMPGTNGFLGLGNSGQYKGALGKKNTR